MSALLISAPASMFGCLLHLFHNSWHLFTHLVFSPTRLCTLWEQGVCLPHFWIASAHRQALKHLLIWCTSMFLLSIESSDFRWPGASIYPMLLLPFSQGNGVSLCSLYEVLLLDLHTIWKPQGCRTRLESLSCLPFFILKTIKTLCVGSCCRARSADCPHQGGSHWHLTAL